MQSKPFSDRKYKPAVLHPYKTEAVYYLMWTDGYDFIHQETYLGRCFIDDKKYKLDPN